MAHRDDGVARDGQRLLYAAYGLAAAGLAYGAWRGWFTSWPRFTSDVVPGGLLLLVFLTHLVRGTPARQAPPRSMRRTIQSLALGATCLLAALGWAFAAAPRLPDTHVGVAILAVPAVVASLVAGYCFWQVSRGVPNGPMHALSALTALEDIAPDPAAVPAPATLPERLDVPVNIGAAVLRYVAGVLWLLGTWWLLGHDSILVSTIVASGLLFLTYLNGRVIVGGGPGLVLSSSGVAIRAGLGPLRAVPWNEISGFSLKSSRLSTTLVIGLHDAAALMARQRGYRRWSMQQSAQLFGSPAFVAASLLQCDSSWLLRTALAYRAKLGTP